MPRPTIFSKMGFKPDPHCATSKLMQDKKRLPFYNRVTHPHIDAKQRYASFNFPLDQKLPVSMKDTENPNVLDSVRIMS